MLSMRILSAAAFVAILLNPNSAFADGPGDEARSGHNIVVDTASGECFDLIPIECPTDETPVRPADLSLAPIPISEIVIEPVEDEVETEDDTDDEPVEDEADTDDDTNSEGNESKDESEPKKVKEPKPKKVKADKPVRGPVDFYFSVGPSLAMAYGHPIAGVSIEISHGDDIVVSQGVSALRTDSGLLVGFGWETNRGGMFLSGRVAQRSDFGVTGTVSAVRYTTVNDHWAIGAGVAVTGASYEWLGQSKPGSVEVGGGLEGFARFSIMIDDETATALDFTVRPSVVMVHQADPKNAKLGVLGGLSGDVVLRF